MFIWYSNFTGHPVFIFAKLSNTIWMPILIRDYVNWKNPIQISPRVERTLQPLGGAADGALGWGEWKIQDDLAQSRVSHFSLLGLSFIPCTGRDIELNSLWSLVQLQMSVSITFGFFLGFVKGISLSFFWSFNCGKKWINHVKFRKTCLPDEHIWLHEGDGP